MYTPPHRDEVEDGASSQNDLEQIKNQKIGNAGLGEDPVR